MYERYLLAKPVLLQTLSVRYFLVCPSFSLDSSQLKSHADLDVVQAHVPDVVQYDVLNLAVLVPVGRHTQVREDVRRRPPINADVDLPWKALYRLHVSSSNMEQAIQNTPQTMR